LGWGFIIDFGQFPPKSCKYRVLSLDKKLFVLCFEAAQGLRGEVEISGKLLFRQELK
jgi:hypothetical protein